MADHIFDLCPKSYDKFPGHSWVEEEQHDDDYEAPPSNDDVDIDFEITQEGKDIECGTSAEYLDIYMEPEGNQFPQCIAGNGGIEWWQITQGGVPTDRFMFEAKLQGPITECPCYFGKAVLIGNISFGPYWFANYSEAENTLRVEIDGNMNGSLPYPGERLSIYAEMPDMSKPNGDLVAIGIDGSNCCGRNPDYGDGLRPVVSNTMQTALSHPNTSWVFVGQTRFETPLFTGGVVKKFYTDATGEVETEGECPETPDPNWKFTIDMENVSSDEEKGDPIPDVVPLDYFGPSIGDFVLLYKEGAEHYEPFTNDVIGENIDSIRVCGAEMFFDPYFYSIDDLRAANVRISKVSNYDTNTGVITLEDGNTLDSEDFCYYCTPEQEVNDVFDLPRFDAFLDDESGVPEDVIYSNGKPLGFSQKVKPCESTGKFYVDTHYGSFWILPSGDSIGVKKMKSHEYAMRGVAAKTLLLDGIRFIMTTEGDLIKDQEVILNVTTYKSHCQIFIEANYFVVFTVFEGFSSKQKQLYVHYIELISNPDVEDPQPSDYYNCDTYLLENYTHHNSSDVDWGDWSQVSDKYHDEYLTNLCSGLESVLTWRFPGSNDPDWIKDVYKTVFYNSRLFGLSSFSIHDREITFSTTIGDDNYSDEGGFFGDGYCRPSYCNMKVDLETKTILDIEWVGDMYMTYWTVDGNILFKIGDFSYDANHYSPQSQQVVVDNEYYNYKILHQSGCNSWEEDGFSTRMLHSCFWEYREKIYEKLDFFSKINLPSGISYGVNVASAPVFIQFIGHIDESQLHFNDLNCSDFDMNWMYGDFRNYREVDKEKGVVKIESKSPYDVRQMGNLLFIKGYRSYSKNNDGLQLNDRYITYLNHSPPDLDRPDCNANTTRHHYRTGLPERTVTMHGGAQCEYWHYYEKSDSYNNLLNPATVMGKVGFSNPYWYTIESPTHSSVPRSYDNTPEVTETDWSVVQSPLHGEGYHYEEEELIDSCIVDLESGEKLPGTIDIELDYDRSCNLDNRMDTDTNLVLTAYRVEEGYSYNWTVLWDGVDISDVLLSKLQEKEKWMDVSNIQGFGLL